MNDLTMSTIRLSIPLILAALGGLLSERSGVANIALEANLLLSAFTSAAVVSLAHNLPIGIAAGVASSVALSLLFSWVCVYGRGDQIVVGTAFNFLAVGMVPLFCRTLFGVTGSTPSLPIDLRLSEPLVFALVGVIAAFGLTWVFRSTKWGLRVHAAGENPVALETQGVNHKRVRILAIAQGGVLTGFAGVYMSLCQASGFTRGMSGGRGFIALAALIFGGWKPIPTLLACLFFGFTDALQISMQSILTANSAFPTQLVQVAPYLASLAVLAVFNRRIRAPAAINQDSA